MLLPGDTPPSAPQSVTICLADDAITDRQSEYLSMRPPLMPELLQIRYPHCQWACSTLFICSAINRQSAA